MSRAEGVIFDMDGTLYPFNEGQKFAETKFGQTIIGNGIQFFETRFSLSPDDAKIKYQEMSDLFNGEVSLGLEEIYGIPRADFFAATWGLDATEFVPPQAELTDQLESIDVRRGLLSAAPSIWVNRVLGHLGIKGLFGDSIFTGEPDIRKPNAVAFSQISDHWEVAPPAVIAIGDQEHTDIIPAKSIGMITVLIALNQPASQADFVAPTIHSALEQLRKEKLL
jgi:putative hydrolase of the HAD superfamily